LKKFKPRLLLGLGGEIFGSGVAKAELASKGWNDGR
jgi:hypothetical protein